MILIIILYMLFASTFTFGKMALEVVQPIFFIACRMLIAGALLLGFTYFLNRSAWKLRKSDWHLYLQLMVIHIYLAFTLEFWALQYVSAAKASLIYNLSPFVTALFSYFLLSERLNKQKWLGLAIGFVGMLPILLSVSPGDQHSFLTFSLAEIALLGSVACSALGWMAIKKANKLGYSVVMANGIGMLGGGLLALISSRIFEGSPMLKMPAQEDLISSFFIKYSSTYAPLLLFLFYTFLLIIIANLICYNLYGYLLSHYSATFLSFAGFTVPLFTALYDFILTKQIIGWPFLVSFLCTSLGLYIFYRNELLYRKTRDLG